jgi:hypothetical protein
LTIKLLRAWGKTLIGLNPRFLIISLRCELRLDKKGDARADVAFNLIEKSDLYRLLSLLIDGGV